MATELSKKQKTTNVNTYPRYRFVIAGLVLAAHFSIGLSAYAISPFLLLVIEDFGVSATKASLLAALPVLLRAVFGLPGSMIVAKFGLKRIFTLSWFMVGALALSPIAPNFLALLLLRLCYGIGVAIMMPATGPIIMQWFPQKERTLINSLDIISLSLGISSSVAIATPLTKFLSWQGVLGLFGIIGLLGALLWNFFGQTRSNSQEIASEFSVKDVWRVLRNRTIFLLIIGDALVFIQYAALTNWLPTYYYEFRDMTLSQAGYVTSMLTFVGIFAVLIGGFLALKVKKKKLLFIIPGIMVGIGSLGSILLRSIAGIYLSVFILGVGTWVYQPILLTLPMQLPWMTPKKIAVVWGTSMTVASSGMFISPIVVGASRDIFNTFVPGFLVWSVLAWALVFTGVFLPKLED